MDAELLSHIATYGPILGTDALQPTINENVSACGKTASNVTSGLVTRTKSRSPSCDNFHGLLCSNTSLS